MPDLQLRIVRAYWGEHENLITYVVEDDVTGEERKLVADRGANPGMWRLLYDALQKQGYNGPQVRKARSVHSIAEL